MVPASTDQKQPAQPTRTPFRFITVNRTVARQDSNCSTSRPACNPEHSKRLPPMEEEAIEFRCAHRHHPFSNLCSSIQTGCSQVTSTPANVFLLGPRPADFTASGIQDDTSGASLIRGFRPLTSAGSGLNLAVPYLVQVYKKYNCHE